MGALNAIGIIISYNSIIVSPDDYGKQNLKFMICLRMDPEGYG